VKIELEQARTWEYEDQEGNTMNLNIFKQMAKVKEKMAEAQAAVRQKTVEASVGAPRR